MNLNQEHLACVARPRRLLNHYDPAFFRYRPALLSAPAFAEVVLDFTRWDDFHFDTVLWDIHGAMASYPSKFIPHYPGMKEWLDDGNDFLSHVVSGSRDRGLEVFLSFRVNAGRDPNFEQVSFKGEHEDWLVNFNEDLEGPPQLCFERRDGELSQLKWDYAHPDLRAYQVAALQELVTNYDIDGIQLDFARGAPFLHVGHQWMLRDHLTQFVGDVRAMMRQRAMDRGRPLLLAVRIAESIEGCHFDGIDIETWIRQDLVDLTVLGCRSFDVDIAAFKRLVAATPVKVYPCHDNHHSSDGYKCTPLRVLRGIASNWWQQGADGIGVFNFTCSDGLAEERVGLREGPISPVHRQDWDSNRTFLSEAGDLQKLADKPKTFVVQRRAGGAPWEFGFPEDGITADHSFQNANLLAPLPARLGQHGKGTTILHLYVGAETASFKGVEAKLRMLVSDEASEMRAETDRIERGLIRRHPYVLGDGLWTVPLTQQTAASLEVRINNMRLQCGGVDEGWLVYPVQAVQLASGLNLLTIRLPDDSEGISVEKIELDLDAQLPRAG